MRLKLSIGWIGNIATTIFPTAHASAENYGPVHESVLQCTVRTVSFVVTTALFACAVANSTQAQGCVGTARSCFQGLGFLSAAPPKNGPSSRSAGIGPDGGTVVGWSTDANGKPQAFSWTAGVMTGLGFLGCSNEDCTSEAWAVNGVGKIAGWSSYPGGNIYVAEGFIGSSSSGIKGLGFLINGTCLSGPSSQAFAIASGADVPVGSGCDPSKEDESELVIFFPANPIGELGSLGPFQGSPCNCALGVDADGTVVVGQSSGYAFVWRAAEITQLPLLKSTDGYSAAYAVSNDGSIIVGTSELEGVRWVKGNVEDLGMSSAVAVSAEGNVVVGQGPEACSSTSCATRWTPIDGAQSIEQLLTAAGVNLRGWSLWYATGVSADGTTITGVGMGPIASTQEAWIARLPVPTGATAALTATPATGQTSLDVTFHASGLTPPMTYTINFGDGTKGGVSQGGCVGMPPDMECFGAASHTYTGAGTYTATLLNASDITLGAATITVGENLVRPLRPPALRGVPTSPLPPVAISRPPPERHALDQ